jgi:hypothetical protein
MEEALYLRILDDLSDINYSGSITYSRYNEPLAEREIILQRIQQARQRLPRAHLFTHTNGDFVTRDYLDSLRVAGLNTLRIQTYLGNKEHWDDYKMVTRQSKQLARLGLTGTPIVNRPGVRYMVQTDYKGMDVTIDARNFDDIGTDRGGLVQLRRKVARTAPCFIVFQHLYIDYNGSVVPCCNIRSDVPEHGNYVVGTLGTDLSIFQAYANLSGWRRSLLTFGPKKAPCDTCAYDPPPFNADLAKKLNEIATRMLPQQSPAT